MTDALWACNAYPPLPPHVEQEWVTNSVCVKKAIATAVRKFNCFKDKKKYDIRELIHLGTCIVHFTYFEFNKVKHVLESGAASVI